MGEGDIGSSECVGLGGVRYAMSRHKETGF